MTATATHDTKRGEDTRARIDVLTEMPRDWAARVRHWATLNRRAKTGAAGRPMPGRNDEYFLYQTLVGAWPLDLMDAQRLDPAALDAFRDRVDACMLKAVREAKVHSSWAQPNADYEEALSGFVRRILDPEGARLFLADFTEFAASVAWFGMLNGLSQALLKMTVPGVPDLYQGAELWDLSLVDPDNRRPVDFERRRALLADLRRDVPDDRPAEPAALRALLDRWTDGRIKMLILSRLLRLRRAHGTLFHDGAYLPLTVGGPHAEHVCAFARIAGGKALVVAAPRLFARLGWGREPPLGARWADTAIVLPPALAADGWTDVLSGATVSAEPDEGEARLTARALFAHLPVAALLGRGAGETPP